MAAPRVLLLAALACIVIGASSAATRVFPYRDNCRPDPTFSTLTLTALKPTKGSDGMVNMCFKVGVKDKCKPEVFKQGGKKVTSRCCNMDFAKIKFFVDPTCKAQFSPGKLTVPNSKRDGISYDRVVSPVWTQNYLQEVKYTQFGPIPHTDVDGTTFCLQMKPGPCKLSDFSDISNPKARSKRQFLVALYDRKKNGYECCPTFSLPTDMTNAKNKNSTDVASSNNS